MKREASEVERFGQIEPQAVAAYLKATGWIQEESTNRHATLWRRWHAVEGLEYEVLLPLNREVGDFLLRLAEAVETLASFEGRSQFEVMVALQDKGSITGVLERTESVADSLVRLWGLDIFGLNALSRRAIVELRFAAVMLGVIFSFDLILWSSLFTMLLGLKFAPVALVLGALFAVSGALYRRQLFTADFGAHGGIRRFLSLVPRVLVIIASTICIIPAAELIVFRGPIENRIVQDRLMEPQAGVKSEDFFHRIKVLSVLLREDDEDGKIFMVVHLLVVFAVSAITLITPLIAFTLRSEDLGVYYSSWQKVGNSSASLEKGSVEGKTV